MLGSGLDRNVFFAANAQVGNLGSFENGLDWTIRFFTRRGLDRDIFLAGGVAGYASTNPDQLDWTERVFLITEWTPCRRFLGATNRGRLPSP
ncbi:hypothetical protein [Blastopirellula retiformator]|uniref:hypothetical protein n=1 Tax=Blastopirellula retiformator TaxID=2527970 RepID=UPI0011B630FB|nr:hypothetical protein [Blastopirellula retiformator]